MADSAVVSKSLSIFNILVDCLDLRFLPLADQYINLFLDNANTGYAEVCNLRTCIQQTAHNDSGNRYARKSHRTFTPSSASNGDQYTPLRRNSSPLAHPPPIHSVYGTYPRALHMVASSCHHRRARYLQRISQIVGQLPAWREERLPPPRVSQSQYDKVGLTSMFLFPTRSYYITHELDSPAMGVGFRAWSSSTSNFPLHHRLAVRMLTVSIICSC